MKYLSIDLEATGLREKDLIIEYAMVPFDASTGKLENELSEHFFVQCPSYESMEDDLDPWVKKHNEELIRKAHSEGLENAQFKERMTQYLESTAVKNYFGEGKITLFGKSLSAIDLPFLNRDLGWEFMRHHFSHRQLDLSSTAYALIDMGLIPEKCTQGSALMEYLDMGEVCHTALEDAVNTAIMYVKLIEKSKLS
jgi:oligoribonuclease (3'-5' exoribonuclease)